MPEQKQEKKPLVPLEKIKGVLNVGKILPLKDKILSLSFFSDPFRVGDLAENITDFLNFKKYMKIWPDYTKEVLAGIPENGIFMTGIESSDPFVDQRRNQLKEAHNFYENYEARLQKISDLGIKWVRFGLPYSETHTASGSYNFELMDKVLKKSGELGLTIIADLLHFGLPDWLHQENSEEPYFQNTKFPEQFAKYAGVFAARYPSIKYFTPVNEPFVTALFSAKLGIWNEKKVTEWNNDGPFVRAVCNVARAAILARKAIEEVFEKEKRAARPIFVQNESFEKAVAIQGSGREEEAERFNLRRFAALDLITGHKDKKMKIFLLEQGMGGQDYKWFMENGKPERTILGIDHYPWCVHTYEKDKSYDHNVSHPYQLYDLTKEYWQRYKLPLLHTEINAWPEFAGSICLLTYDALSRLRKEGYPVLGMTWYGDEYQVGWHVGLTGPKGFEETPVGLYYKGEKQDVAELYEDIIKAGFSPIAIKKNLELKDFLKKYLNFQS